MNLSHETLSLIFAGLLAVIFIFKLLTNKPDLEIIEPVKPKQALDIIELSSLGYISRAGNIYDMSHYYLDITGQLYSRNSSSWEINRKSGKDILIRQIAGAVARRIISYPVEKDKVSSGDELGFIRFGSRVDLFLPPDSQILVSRGQKARGSKTPVAHI